jgi:hypothetical protein
MTDPDIPRHIKRDAQKLAYDRTIEQINRICDTFGREPALLAAVATSSMTAAFLMLYCSARLQCGEVPPHKLLDVWRDAMSKEFDLMQKGFNIAADFTNMTPNERAKYDA